MKNKACTKCSDEHPATLEFFPLCKRKKDGLSSWCRMCHKKAIRKWQKRYSKQYYQKHKKQMNYRTRQYHRTILGCLRQIYSNMNHRCNNPKHNSYKNYGGRGVILEFTSDEFVDYVVNNLQVDPRGLQIDRIDNNGNYERGNIRFVTCKENNNNRRDNVKEK